ncbi:CBO0543 family protein [Sporomusa aerivorans]|uniref:CBO0543 family protein n=1 Tax=Sporomusa aerivorans TaxID=204936 RepID=UPI00352B1EBF
MGYSFDGSKEMYISILSLAGALAGSYYTMRVDWKRYGLLYLIAGLIGNALCYLFVAVDFYSFPYIFLPVMKIPLVAILTAFSFYVVFGVRYSPVSWVHKIMFYGVLINTGVFIETVLQNTTRLIHYDFEWDLWDSYTTWWAFFILMEWLGGKIIPQHLRAPLSTESFRFDNWFWFVIHLVAVFTIFLAGLYLGLQIERK